jgi:hypothetical protein
LIRWLKCFGTRLAGMHNRREDNCASRRSQTNIKETLRMSKPNHVQGEGNYEAAKEYNEAQRKFVQSGKVDAAARKAKPQSEAEAQEMKRAEQVGRSHAKEEDPAIKHGGGGSSSRKP